MGKYQHYIEADSDLLRKKIAILLVLGMNKQSICQALNISKGKLYRLRNKDSDGIKYEKTQIEDYLSDYSNRIFDMSKEELVKQIWGEDYKSLCLFLYRAGFLKKDIIHITDIYGKRSTRYQFIKDQIAIKKEKDKYKRLIFTDNSTLNDTLNKETISLWHKNISCNNQSFDNDNIVIIPLQSPNEKYSFTGKGQKILFRYEKIAMNLLHEATDIALIVFHWKPRSLHFDIDDAEFLIRYKSVKFVISINNDGFIGYLSKNRLYKKQDALAFLKDTKQIYARNERLALSRFVSYCKYFGIDFDTFVIKEASKL